MNIQERIEALETEFNEKIKTLKAEAQREQEFPQDGDEYRCIDSEGWVSKSYTYLSGDDRDTRRLSIGNVFRTREQAAFAVDKLKVEAELRKFSRPFELGENNYYIYYIIEEHRIEVNSMSYRQKQGTIYFESREKVNEVIQSVGEERIKKYIFGVED